MASLANSKTPVGLCGHGRSGAALAQRVVEVAVQTVESALETLEKSRKVPLTLSGLGLSLIQRLLSSTRLESSNALD